MSEQTPQRPAIQHADDGTPVGMQYSSCPDCNAQELADALVEARKEIIRLKALCEELREAIIAMGKDKVSMGRLCSQVLVRSDLLNSALRVAAKAALKKAQKP